MVYSATCRLCKYTYIGNTQQTLKKRMLGHFNDIKKLVQDGTSSDSFAKHFGIHFTLVLSNDDLRWLFDFGITVISHLSAQFEHERSVHT